MTSELVSGFNDFFQLYRGDRNYVFVGDINLPTDSELSLIALIQTATGIWRDALVTIRATITSGDAYTLWVFAVRMAIWAARSNSPAVLRAAAIGLVVDDDRVDWRDILGALSLFEYCAGEVGVDFREVMQPLCSLASSDRQHLIFEGYFARSPESRNIRTMGFLSVGTGKTLSFIDRIC